MNETSVQIVVIIELSMIMMGIWGIFFKMPWR